MLKGYYFITDSQLSRRGNINDVRSALACGVKVIQYRNKVSGTKEMYDEALKIKSMCKAALFLVNDRLDIALSINADGVHLGSEDLPYAAARKLLGAKKIIGLTAHSVEEARQAQKMGADYIGVSPIFATKTKTGAGRPIGIEMLRAIRKQVSIPIIAIGGINLANAEEVVRAGADGLCAISAVITKQDVKKEIEKFQALF